MREATLKLSNQKVASGLPSNAAHSVGQAGDVRCLHCYMRNVLLHSLAVSVQCCYSKLRFELENQYNRNAVETGDILN